MAEAKSHQSVDWHNYFEHIRKECPWSWSAWQQGLIDIVEYQGVKQPLAPYQARMYVIHSDPTVITSICSAFDYEDSQDEWLYSYPGYGDWATPVGVLIQQNRKQLQNLRQQLEKAGSESVKFSEASSTRSC